MWYYSLVKHDCNHLNCYVPGESIVIVKGAHEILLMILCRFEIIFVLKCTLHTIQYDIITSSEVCVCHLVISTVTVDDCRSES